MIRNRDAEILHKKPIKKKRFAIAVAAILCSVFSLTGCGEKKEDINSVLTQAKSVFDTAGTVKADMDAEISYALLVAEKKIPSKMEYHLSVESSKNISYIRGTVYSTVDAEKKDYEIESYQVDNVGNVTTYYKENNTWYRQNGEAQKTHTSLELLKYAYEHTDTFTMEQQENGDYVIAGTIPESEADASVALSGAQGDTQITLVADGSTKQLKTLKIAIKGGMAEGEEVQSSIESFAISIDFSFDSAVVILNADAKQAKEKTLSTPTDTSKKEEAEPSSETEPTEGNNSSGETMESEEPEEPKQEGLLPNWNAFQFQFDGTVYQMPVSHDDLSDMGYSVKEEDKTVILEAGTDKVLTAYSGDNMMLIRVKNDSDVQRTVYECPVISVQFDDYDMQQEEMAKVLLNGNLTLAVSRDEIIAAYGEPTETHEGKAFHSLLYKDEEASTYFQFDVDSMVLTQAKLQKQ